MLLVLFLVVHLLGLILAILAPTLFEIYATTLHSSPWLGSFEIGLAVICLTHIFLTLTKTIQNSQTGNTAHLVSRRKGFFAIWAARSQPVGGTFLLLFLFMHLKELRFPRPPSGAEITTLNLVLKSPITIFIYIFAAFSLFLHMFHGLESSQRSLGLLTSENSLFIRTLGRRIAFILSSGFILATLLFGGILRIN